MNMLLKLVAVAAVGALGAWGAPGTQYLIKNQRTVGNIKFGTKIAQI